MIELVVALGCVLLAAAWGQRWVRRFQSGRPISHVQLMDGEESLWDFMDARGWSSEEIEAAIRAIRIHRAKGPVR